MAVCPVLRLPHPVPLHGRVYRVQMCCGRQFMDLSVVVVYKRSELAESLGRIDRPWLFCLLQTWCYSYPKNGACLVRMSQLLPESDFKACEEK